MPQFNYTGTDHKTSAEYQGTIEAASEREAVDKLRERGIIAGTIDGHSSGGPGALQPPAPGEPYRSDFPADFGRPANTWFVGIGGLFAAALAVLAFLGVGNGQLMCGAIGLVLLVSAFLCWLHIVIVDAMQTTAARKLQVHQCQQLAMLIEQNRKIIEAAERRDRQDGGQDGG